MNDDDISDESESRDGLLDEASKDAKREVPQQDKYRPNKVRARAARYRTERVRLSTEDECFLVVDGKMTCMNSICGARTFFSKR